MSSVIPLWLPIVLSAVAIFVLNMMPNGIPSMVRPLALWQMTIWYRRPWKSTLKSTIDGLVYAVVTGLVFVWLWPN